MADPSRLLPVAARDVLETPWVILPMEVHMSMFQARHFEALAAIIRGLPEQAFADNVAMAEAMAEGLAEHNPKFDRARFVKACEPAPGFSHDRWRA